MMESRNRVPGGEKNHKSGTQWTKEEIQEVFRLYLELDGKGIHETNPKIISLAERLGRTVRSTEAQAIMFRSIEKDEYGYKKMSKYVREVYQDYYSNKTGKMQAYPLANWGSESSGGVRKPFDQRTGRPAGKSRFETRLSKRISRLISSLDQVRCIFLVGGPGNGKTDSIEFIVSEIDREYGLNGDLTVHVAERFEDYGWRETVPLDGFDLPINQIDIIQDASDYNKGTKQGSIESFLSLVDDLIDEYQGLCICCINRGILDGAKRTIHRNRTNYSDDIRNFILELTESIGPHAIFDGKPCWPFQEKHYAWPMDVDSLVEDPSNGEEVGDQILHKALELIQPGIRSFNGFNDLNYKHLAQDNYAKSLQLILRKFEVAGSYRFTFRDLFSFYGSIFLDTRQPEIDFNQNSDPIERFKILKDQIDCQYYNFLFSSTSWGIDLDIILDMCLKLKNHDSWRNSEYDLREYFKILIDKPESLNTSIRRLLSRKEFQDLDPAKANSEVPIGGTEITFAGIDRSFSRSIENGLEYTRSQLSVVEVSFLESISTLIRTALDPETVRRNYEFERFKLRALLLNYSSKLVKRAIGVRNGVLSDDVVLITFLKSLGNEQEVRRFIKEALRPALLQDENVRVSLGAAIGQPKDNLEHDAYIDVNFEHAFKPYIADENMPSWTLIAIRESNSDPILINYQLFQSLYKRGKLLADPGCIPPHALIAIGRITDTITSKDIHDIDKLYQLNKRLQLGKKGEVEIEPQSFKYIEHG